MGKGGQGGDGALLNIDDSKDQMRAREKQRRPKHSQPKKDLKKAGGGTQSVTPREVGRHDGTGRSEDQKAGEGKAERG